MSDSDTIYAVSTGHGTAAIAAIRLSGKATPQLLANLCGGIPSARQAKLARIIDPRTQELLDRGLVLWFPAPASFTGEDCAELHLHGGRAVVSGVLDAIGSFAGTRAAEPGEFTLRAFKNGKLNLVEVEGLADLLAAKTASQRRQALAETDQTLRVRLETWYGELLALRARIEAAIDFVDEAGVAEAALRDVGSRIDRLSESVEKALLGSLQGEAICEGIRVVIAGPPNAGKSSLLNLLAGREAAIVSSIPGTTRDTIEVMLDMGGLPVIFTDTAGLRDDVEDEVEKIGITRARHEASRAHVVIWLTENDREAPPSSLSDSDPIWVQNKSDLPQSQSGLLRNDPHYRISIKTGNGVEDFLAALRRRVSGEFNQGESAAFVHARQRECLLQLASALGMAKARDHFALELVADDLRSAGDALARLTGKMDVEEVLGEIFSSFCIGK
jgi:tRNA modification GTPase